MPDHKRSKRVKFDVGYRRPPKETQFTVGESGNPKGRPKGSRPVGAVLQDIIQQKVSVTEGGKTRRLSALEVMLRRLAKNREFHLQKPKSSSQQVFGTDRQRGCAAMASSPFTMTQPR